MTIDSTDHSKIFESDHQYESNLESDVRFEIESNQEALQVPSLHTATMVFVISRQQ